MTQRFDNYLCYVIDTPKHCRWYNSRPLYRIWRKGIAGGLISWWWHRSQISSPKNRRWTTSKNGGASELPSIGIILQRDVTERTSTTTLSITRRNRETGLVVKSISKAPAPPSNETPLYHGQRPEWCCQPTMGIPHVSLRHTYRYPAENGPLNTAHVDVHRSGTVTADNYERWQNWIDPERSFMTVRKEFLRVEMLFDGSKRIDELRKIVVTPEMPRASTWTQVESMAQSPRGYWVSNRFANK